LVEAAIDDLFLYDWAKIDTTEDTTGQEAIDDDLIFSGVFPNPASEYINIYFTNDVTGEIEIVLYNNVGEMILTDIQNAIAGKTYTLQTGTLPAGIYMLSCKTEIGTANKRIMIQHE